MNLKILLFNNRIYGLTKGQYSPTSEVGKITKSTPMGSLDAPFNPVSLAIGAEASFVARTVDSDRKHLTDVLRQAAAHPGTALVEIYQNCNIFNDGAFEVLKDRQQAEEAVIRLEHGQPIRFGADGSRGVVRDPRTGDLQVVTVTPDNASQVLVHDAHTTSPTTAFALSRLADPDTLHHTPIGVFRSVDRPVYDTQMSDQLDAAIEQNGKGDLAALLGRRRHLDGRRLNPSAGGSQEARGPSPRASSYALRARSTSAMRSLVHSASDRTCSAASRPRSVRE